MSTLLIFALLLSLGTVARAETRTFPLRHLTPGALAQTLGDELQALLPEGIEAMTLELKKSAVTFTGTPEALAQVETLLKLLDVPPIRMKVTLKIVQGTRSAQKDGMAINNKPLLLTEPGRYRFHVTPHRSASGLIWMLIESPVEKFYKKVAPGKAESIRFADCVVWVTVEAPRNSAVSPG